MDTDTATKAALLAALQTGGWSVATAESLTGGELAAALSEPAGASAAFVGGAVCYATRLKRDLLGVPAEVLDSDGVVSAACAEAMAAGARRVFVADYALATTGVAGPTEQDGQPVGTVFLGLAGPHGVQTRRLALEGDRAEIRAATVRAALDLLGEALQTSGSLGR